MQTTHLVRLCLRQKDSAKAEIHQCGLHPVMISGSTMVGLSLADWRLAALDRKLHLGACGLEKNLEEHLASRICLFAEALRCRYCG